VIRLNLPPTGGFEKHVGSRTSYDLVNDHYASMAATWQHNLVSHVTHSVRNSSEVDQTELNKK
jgi:hypothetical protein